MPAIVLAALLGVAVGGLSAVRFGEGKPKSQRVVLFCLGFFGTLFLLSGVAFSIIFITVER